MAAEKEVELIEEYLANKMPIGERAAFEKRIETETGLQNEIALQKSVMEGLRKARATELKTLLNNVPISAINTGGSTIFSKVMIGAAVTVLVGTGIYLALFNEKQHENPILAEEIVSEKNVPASTPASEPEKEVEQQPVALEEDTQADQRVANVEKSTSKKKATKTAPSTAAEPKIEVFDPTAELTENVSESGENDLLSDDDKVSTVKATIAVSVDSASHRHTFHYQLTGDQLTLYGPFERNLYEILEFFSENKRTAFLYYKNSYYHIKESDKVTTLAPVQDPALLNKLRKHRTKG